MSVRAEAYQLRYTAGRLAAGAQELRRKASQVQGVAQRVTQGPQAWTGGASHAFEASGEGIHQRLLQASDALERTASIFHTLAAKVEQIESMRRQADNLESEAWSLPNQTPEEQERVIRKMRRVSELRHQADLEAQIADQQAASAFGQVSVPSGAMFGAELRRGPYDNVDFDGIPDKWKRKYLQNSDLFVDHDATTYNKLTPGAYKREDNESSTEYLDKREQLTAMLKDIIHRQDVAGYITDPDAVQKIIDDLFGEYYGDYTLEELATAIKQRTEGMDLEADMQAKRLAGEDITKDPRYYLYVLGQLIMPTAIDPDSLSDMTAGKLYGIGRRGESASSGMYEGKGLDYFDEHQYQTDQQNVSTGNGRYSRTNINGDSFESQIGAILERKGISKEEFEKMRKTPTDQLTGNEVELIKEIRSEVSIPKVGEVMQKIIGRSDLEKYLNNTYTGIGGFVAKAVDVLEVKTPDGIKEALRLDYEGNPFNEPTLWAIRYKYSPDHPLVIPFGGNDVTGANNMLREGAGIIAPPPFTGNGFTLSEGHVIPEFRNQGYVDIPKLSEIYVIRTDGTEVRIALFDGENWIRQEE